MRKLTKKTIIPLAIALALILIGAIGAFAVTPSGMLESEDYRAKFYLNHLQVHLLENGEDVCGGKNELGNPEKITGQLVQYLGYSRDGDAENLGSVEPGKWYREEVAAENGQNVPIYVRMTIKKYWVETNEAEEEEPQSDDQQSDDQQEGGEQTKTVTAGDKNPALSPDKIKLMYKGKEFNSDAWFINESESTAEQTTYYYKTQLAGNDKTDLLFDGLVIDSKLLEKVEDSRTEKDGVTTIKYKYLYDGYAFIIKADVQAIQTHNANDAIHSQWGVYDVTEKDGKLSAGN